MSKTIATQWLGLDPTYDMWSEPGGGRGLGFLCDDELWEVTNIKPAAASAAMSRAPARCAAR